MINQQRVEVFVSKTKDWFVWSWFESSYTNGHTDNIDCEIKSKYDPRKMMGDFRFLFFKFEIYTSYSETTSNANVFNNLFDFEYSAKRVLFTQ